MYKIIATGSKGNAIMYHDAILLDCGVPYSFIKEYAHELQLVLLTHAHKDHINKTTIKRLAFERPTLMFGCCEWMMPMLEGIRNVDVYEIGKVYDYGSFSISPVKLYHNVPNCGYRIFKDGNKIFHATDTCHLEGISAKGYDLYAIEHNYDEDIVYDSIAKLKAMGRFAHQQRSINTHLSEQQANDFIFKNKSENSVVIRLHEHKE